MKYKGQKIPPNVRTVVFKREGFDIVFNLKAIESYEAFEQLCGLPPVKPTALIPGKGLIEEETPAYRQALAQYCALKSHYHILWTLKATEGLEWEQVDLNKPDTWIKWLPELFESGLAEGEITHLMHKIREVNTLDEAKLEKDRDDFLAGQQEQQNKLSLLQAEQQSMQSSGPVNASG